MPGGFSLVVANSYDFFLLGTDAPNVFEIFISAHPSNFKFCIRILTELTECRNRAQRFEGFNFCARQTL
jgi:hypothetical protein